MRKLLWVAIILSVLVGAYVAADFGLQSVAQGQVASSLETSLDLSAKPEVDMGGFPFILRAIDGHLRSVTVEGSHLSAGDQPLKSVALRLQGVSFSGTALVAGRHTTVRFKGSQGRAELTGSDVTVALGNAGLPVQAEVRGGKVFVSGGPVTQKVEVKPTLEGDTLVLTPTGLPIPIALRIDLSDLLPDIRLTGIKVKGSVAAITLTLTKNEIDV